MAFKTRITDPVPKSTWEFTQLRSLLDRARKAANESRQEILKKERAEKRGDPVRGTTTPFVESFDTASPLPPMASFSKDFEIEDASSLRDNMAESNMMEENGLNFYLSAAELKDSLSWSSSVTAPPPDEEYNVRRKSKGFKVIDKKEDQPSGTQRKTRSSQEQHAYEDKRARDALLRITSLANGSTEDRHRVNVQRCIATFGRHNTDSTLPPRIRGSLATPPRNPNQVVAEKEATPRIGKDTGSSEVQIAILTARIRAVANVLEVQGRKDKKNIRIRRILVHRRQRLLRYLRRKERGGPRWQHLVEKLGLT